ncbi:hypothetical protein [Catenibacterium sp.]|uniref:hypothetical protein n=1 Tax=Catenibacterium sp. TaxID=2049022 RepID=UPI002E763AC6|nr:hypothetical protein [Catenibacterium sp.]MEE0041087.1 hypothetical protein [Catenibacterium sp.]
MDDKMIDQTKLAEDLSSKIKYEFRQMFLVKPLEPVKVKKKISEPVVKDAKPKKDKDGIEAVDYDEVKTEIKEVDSDFSRAVVLKLPYEYTHPYDDKIHQMPIKVGDIVIYRSPRGAMYFDLLKDSQIVSLYDIVATEIVEK